MRELTKEEKAVIRTAKEAVNRDRKAKRQDINRRLKGAGYADRKKLEAQLENVAPITGNPVHIRHGANVLPPLDYERFRKAFRSVRHLTAQRVFVEAGNILVLEYRGGGVSGCMEFHSSLDFMELDGLLPVVGL